jgi:hypothetical protein
MAVIALSSLITLAQGSRGAFAAAPWWRVSSSSAPTILPTGGEGKIVVTAINMGDASIAGGTLPATITDKLPPNLTATSIVGFSGEGPDKGVGIALPEFGKVTCSLSLLSCTYAGTLPPYEPLKVEITVVDGGAHPGDENEVVVSGGGAQEASARRPVELSPVPAPFGMETYELTPENEGGSTDSQAGSHPFQLTSLLAFNTTLASGVAKPVALAKDVKLDLPPGLLGNPAAVPQCTEEQFVKVLGFVSQCPAGTAIGVASVTFALPSPGWDNVPRTVAVPIFNLVPAFGEPARFGFEVYEVPVVFDTRVRAGRDYGVTVTVANASEKAAILSSEVTLWGVPGDARHDPSRGWACLGAGIWEQGSCIPGGPSPAHPFLTLPTSCAGPAASSARADSWSQPGSFVESASRLDTEGCDSLPFAPSIIAGSDVHTASTPAGVTVGIHVPQDTTLSSGGLAEADVKGTTVTLPAGMQVSPSAADGLMACSTAQIGFEGVDPVTQSLEFSPAEASCPDESKVADVSIKTPLLANELKGAVYLAAQGANPFGSLLALYLVAQDPVSGVWVKLAGQISLDGATGQVNARFLDTPQLPFEDLRVEFFTGPRAALTTPSRCGAYSTEATFSPWSEGPTVSAASRFDISSGPHGAPCPGPPPFSPYLMAGVSNLQAGAFTPFAMTLARMDGNQNLESLQLHMPPGLLGRLSSVTPCPEPQAARGTCGPESLIGHAGASVGLGSDPYTISGGGVFLSGPYRGAPYGLSITEPAKAGPFDLGSGACDCVVVRAKIEVDPHTGALTVLSDPLPTILQGIPLQIKRINVTIDRPGFTFNPTNCSQLPMSATISGEEGATTTVSLPFEVANCATLPFRPTFLVATQAQTSKAGGASLHVKLTSGPGQANIGRVRVDLPKQLPSRLTTLQKACPDATFNSNPASCPAWSVVGGATAVTPVLKAPITGPAYLVSHAGAAFPDLVIVLQGEGLTLDLVGRTDIRKGMTISTFDAVPDAPISTFDLVLPEGAHSALAAHGNLCRSRLKMPTAITGQNGAVIRQTTRVAVSGCPKHRHRRKARRARSVG